MQQLIPRSMPALTSFSRDLTSHQLACNRTGVCSTSYTSTGGKGLHIAGQSSARFSARSTSRCLAGLVTTGRRLLGEPHKCKASEAAASAAPAVTQDADRKDSAAEEGSIYRRPELYDAAFSYREFKQEVKFIRDAFGKHASPSGSQLNSVLDLGTGPGRHLIGLGKAGVPHLVGLDLCPEMLAYARTQAEKAGVQSSQLELHQGDLSAFDLPKKDFDLVMCLLGTFSHVKENKQAAAAFACIYKHLRPGGVFMLELAHPGDLFDGTFILGDGGKEVWEVPRKDKTKVLVEWGADFDNFDPVSQILYRTVSINVFKGDDVQDSVEEVVPYRQYTVQELDLLCSATGFTLDGLYGDMLRLDIGLSHEDAYRMVAVMRKPEA